MIAAYLLVVSILYFGIALTHYTVRPHRAMKHRVCVLYAALGSLYLTDFLLSILVAG